jgi:hypothetical protein
MISDPMYEPFWTMAEELDFSIGFHEGSTTAMPTVGVDRFEADRSARHMISHQGRGARAASAVRLFAIGFFLFDSRGIVDVVNCYNGPL